MLRILASLILLELVIAAPAFAQNPENSSGTTGIAPKQDAVEHGSGGNAWSGDMGGARAASKNDAAASQHAYVAPVATGLDLKGPAKTEGPFAE